MPRLRAAMGETKPINEIYLKPEWMCWLIGAFLLSGTAAFIKYIFWG